MRLNIREILEEEGLLPDIPITSMLDVGCGISLQSQYFDVQIRVALDAYRRYLMNIRSTVPYVPIHANAQSIAELFPPNSFDVVLLADVIEHLSKPESAHLLSLAHVVAKEYVVVSTPRGYTPQDIDIWKLGGDHYQTHRCGWTAEELEASLYKVIERPHVMTDVPRCTSGAVDPNMTMLYAVRKMHD